VEGGVGRSTRIRRPVGVDSSSLRRGRSWAEELTSPKVATEMADSGFRREAIADAHRRKPFWAGEVGM